MKGYTDLEDFNPQYDDDRYISSNLICFIKNRIKAYRHWNESDAIHKIAIDFDISPQTIARIYDRVKKDGYNTERFCGQRKLKRE